MVFFWTMNIHTQLNVYMWMYLSRTVFIFVKSKKVWAKQGRKFLPFTSTIWSPPQFPPLHRHQELHTCHTRKHTRMYTKSSNAQLTLSQRQSSKLVVSKQTKPQLTAVTKKLMQTWISVHNECRLHSFSELRTI